MITIQEVIRNFPKRRVDSHKGDLGHVLVIAGSSGYTGAAYLASQAAVRSGSGLVTLAISESLHGILATKLTEVMVRPFPETKERSLSLSSEKGLLDFSQRCNSFAIGPGLSQNKETAQLVRNLLLILKGPIVLDADGISAFCGHASDLKRAARPLILTPHAGELAKLTENSVEEIQRNRKDIALALANEYNIVLVLKGHNTIVAAPDGNVYINDTGNPGMASGGVGDLLTGIISGFIAQGVSGFNASVLGVHFHGLAGDLALKDKGPLGLIATDILEKLPEVLKVLA